MKVLKKIGILCLCCLVLLGISVVDYLKNNQSVSALLHTVSVTPYREQISFSAPIRQYENLYLMSGAVRKIDKVAIGDVAAVSLNDRTYEGYLWRLDPLSDGFYYATVSVTNLTAEPKENATAVISGKVHQNIIFVPKECLTIDEKGQDAVYVVQNGYAMLRNVQIGKLTEEGKTQIENGVFAKEQLIISPQNIRTGDKVLSP